MPLLAACSGFAVGLLGGLIGLGGAVFRLPLLVAVFGYALRRAVVLNLIVSFVTVTDREPAIQLEPDLGLDASAEYAVDTILIRGPRPGTIPLHADALAQGLDLSGLIVGSTAASRLGGRR